MTFGFIIRAATEAAIAMTAPTERSTPPVAMTNVMPMRQQHDTRTVAQDVDQASIQIAVLRPPI